MPKLPREVEADPRREAVERSLARDVRPPWPGAKVTTPRVPFTPALETALHHALLSKHLLRGLEAIDAQLDIERRGIEAARSKQQSPPADRTSRLLVLADDGSERFYRQCEATIARNADRLLAIQVEAPSDRLAAKLYGADKLVKVVLVSDRDSVTRVLLALAG
jgi:hypothetical protein